MSDMSAMSGRKQLEHNDQRHDGPERPELIALSPQVTAYRFLRLSRFLRRWFGRPPAAQPQRTEDGRFTRRATADVGLTKIIIEFERPPPK
jgi:hypothetical protein